MRQLAVILTVILSVLNATSADTRPNGRILLTSFLHYGIIQDVSAGRETLTRGTTNEVTAQINAEIDKWVSAQKNIIRKELTDCLGNNAKNSFAFFADHYREAEKNKNLEYLAVLNRQLNIQPPPENFEALRTFAAREWMKDTIADSGRLLADIQTWTDLKNKGNPMPRLDQWLSRNTPPAGISKDSSLRKLASAESLSPELPEDSGDDANVLRSFSGKRAERQKRITEEAKDAMARTAAERKAAEDEYADRKASAAQREAEAVRAYAQKMADTEKEALEQRQQTWGARLTRLTVSVLSGATSAVTSGIGSAAGAAIAEQVFD